MRMTTKLKTSSSIIGNSIIQNLQRTSKIKCKKNRTCTINTTTLIKMEVINEINIINTGKDMGKDQFLYTAGWNVNWYSHYGNQYRGSSQN